MARRIHVIPSMHGLISNGETAPEIRCRPRSMTSANISDGNKHSHPAGMNAVITHLLDGRRPRKRGPATSDTLVPTSCTSRVVGDSERDPLHSELIHPVIGEAATAQHTITHRTIIHSPSSPIDRSTHTTQSTQSSIKRGPPATLDLFSPSKDLNAFLTIYL